MKRMLTEQGYRDIVNDVRDQIFDQIIGDGMIPAVVMSQKVKGYDPDWCADEFVYDDHYKKIVKLARELSDLIAKDYFKYYS